MANPIKNPDVIIKTITEFWNIAKKAFFGFFKLVVIFINNLPPWIKYVAITLFTLGIIRLVWWFYQNIDEWKSRGDI